MRGCGHQWIIVNPLFHGLVVLEPRKSPLKDVDPRNAPRRRHLLRSDEDMNSPATSTTCASNALPSPHRNASPPTPPSSASMESDEDLMNFNLREYRDEISRRRRGGLPLPLTEPEIDIEVRFFLVSEIVCRDFPSHVHPSSLTRSWIPPSVSAISVGCV
jgi:hypothetical protein